MFLSEVVPMLELKISVLRRIMLKERKKSRKILRLGLLGSQQVAKQIYEERFR